MIEITQERLKELLHYDKNTGLFMKSGRKVGWVNEGGYIRIDLDRKKYYAHRLAWLYVHGSFPKFQIDHINGCKEDNKISNLRDVQDFENKQNRGGNKNNRSGYVGVYFDTSINRYRARIGINGKQRNLGSYETPWEAHEAYKKAKAEIHPFSLSS
jgi:hypothetical protein